MSDSYFIRDLGYVIHRYEAEGHPGWLPVVLTDMTEILQTAHSLGPDVEAACMRVEFLKDVVGKYGDYLTGEDWEMKLMEALRYVAVSHGIPVVEQPVGPKE